MSYTVVAPLVLAQDREGRIHHRYEGSTIEWLSDEQAEHFVGLGLVRKAGGGEPSTDEDGKPGDDATKQDLIDWLVANAVTDDGSDYTEGALRPLNKAQLRELVDAVED